MKLLLDRSADVNASPGERCSLTALQAAATGGHLEAMELLLLAGAEINAPPSPVFGYTALQAAAGGSYHFDAVQLLLQKGADLNAAAGSYGSTVLQIAANKVILDVVKLLLEKGADVNEARDLPNGLVKLFLDKGANANAEGKDGKSALNLAVSNNSLVIANLLLARGACVKDDTIWRAQPYPHLLSILQKACNVSG